MSAGIRLCLAVTQEADFMMTSETLDGLASLANRGESTKLASTSSNRQTTTRGKVPTASALVAPVGTDVCIYCRQYHDPRSCSVVTDVKRRKYILRRDGRCFISLKRNPAHLKKLKCGKCQQRHHTTICESASHEKQSCQ